MSQYKKEIRILTMQATRAGTKLAEVAEVVREGTDETAERIRRVLAGSDK